MPRGSTDIFTSRRTNFIDCEYWLIAKEDITRTKEELVFNERPDGFFSAKFENQFENSVSVIGQSFMFDSNTVTISTEDDVKDLKKNCLVKFNGDVWRINIITRIPIRNDFQMSKEIRFKTTMELRR